MLESFAIWLITEQPKGSLMYYHHRLASLSNGMGLGTVRSAFRKHISMGNYGAETSKGAWLYSMGRKSFDALGDYAEEPTTNKAPSLVDRYIGRWTSLCTRRSSLEVVAGEAEPYQHTLYCTV